MCLRRWRGLEFAEQRHHPRDDRFRTRWTTRHIYIERDEDIDRANHVITVVENALRERTRAERHHEARFGHLCVDAQPSIFRLPGDRARHYQQIGLAGAALQFDAKPFYIEARRERPDRPGP